MARDDASACTRRELLFRMNLNIGDRAPAFSLFDQDEKLRRLSEAKGKWVLLYFYPKDLTPGCTLEACTIRDAWEDFDKHNIVVFGVSADSVARHQKFSEKYELPFPLLADEEKKLVQQYGVWGKKKFMGREYMGINRTSFLIDPKGKIVKIYTKVKPGLHAEEVLADVQVFQ
jgi:thioredoxin-dependent peroxiredoxin